MRSCLQNHNIARTGETSRTSGNIDYHDGWTTRFQIARSNEDITAFDSSVIRSSECDSSSSFPSAHSVGVVDTSSVSVLPLPRSEELRPMTSIGRPEASNTRVPS